MRLCVCCYSRWFLGLRGKSNVVVMVATDHVEDLEPYLLRLLQFDRKINVYPKPATDRVQKLDQDQIPPDRQINVG